MIVKALYSCSINISLITWCEKVIDDKDNLADAAL